MSDFAVQDLVPQIPTGQNNSPILWSTDKSWDSSKSLKDTVHYLIVNSVNSYAHQIENCRIISEAKRIWRGQNITEDIILDEKKGEYKHVKTDDWDKLKTILTEQLPYSAKMLEQMDTIWKSRTTQQGGLRYVFDHVTPIHLPASLTALYEIATLKSSDPENLTTLDKIVESITSNLEISVKEIRDLKSNKISLDEVPQTESSKIQTKLILPRNVEELEKLNENWDRILEHIKGINELSDLIEISFDNPAEMINQINSLEEEKKKKSEINQVLRDFKSLVKKYIRISKPKDILNLKKPIREDGTTDLSFKEEPVFGYEGITGIKTAELTEEIPRNKRKNYTKSVYNKRLGSYLSLQRNAEKLNNKVDGVWEGVEKYSLESRCQTIIDEWREEVRLKNEARAQRNAEIEKELSQENKSPEFVETSTETATNDKWRKVRTAV